MQCFHTYMFILYIILCILCCALLGELQWNLQTNTYFHAKLRICPITGTFTRYWMNMITKLLPILRSTTINSNSTQTGGWIVPIKIKVVGCQLISVCELRKRRVKPMLAFFSCDCHKLWGKSSFLFKEKRTPLDSPTMAVQS